MQPASGWVTQAEILDLRVRALALCGRAKESKQHLRTLAIEHPTDALGKAAFSRVELTGSERLRRAQALETARDYVGALRELEGLFDTDVGASARFHRGRIMLTRTRDNFEESASLFKGLCESKSLHTEEACFLQAKARGRAGDIVGALGVQKVSESLQKWTVLRRCRLFSAFLLYESGRYAQARSGFLVISKGPWAQSARWYAAWTAFLAGQSTSALSELEALERDHQGTSLGRKAAYWAIRCLEQLNSKRPGVEGESW